MCDLYGCGDTPSTKPLPRVTDDQRRNFLKGMAVLPLATVLAYPELASAAGHHGTQPVSIPTASGGTAMGVVAMPAKLPAPTVLLIHEWWGLNDQTKAVAAEYAKQGYIALAVDMYGGNVATDRRRGHELDEVRRRQGRRRRTGDLDQLVEKTQKFDR